MNASRYSGHGTMVLLRAHAKGHMICIEVCDNGAGIPLTDLPHIFEQFYRGEKSRNRENGGSGIGLALARRYVEIHGGRISAENQLSGGACFAIELPQAE
ncbi:MAG: sensor histidine kinase [Anaerovibrio sp.]|nr:sensor histidine kinase [Anaerovibrio sp.]